MVVVSVIVILIVIGVSICVVKRSTCRKSKKTEKSFIALCSGWVSLLIVYVFSFDINIFYFLY